MWSRGVLKKPTLYTMTPLGPGYGVTPECMACAPGCDNDMLLMSGFLCHKCLPDNCRDGGGGIQSNFRLFALD